MPDYAINRTLYAVHIRENLSSIDQDECETSVAELVSDTYEDYRMQDEWR